MKKNLIRQFCDDKYFTAAAHFRFEGKTFKTSVKLFGDQLEILLSKMRINHLLLVFLK